jgi:hypothetical protein
MNRHDLFTGETDIDIAILSDLDNKTFYHIYQIDPYVRYLCEQDFRLKNRIKYLNKLYKNVQLKPNIYF